jgi:threonine dehydratase
MNTPALHSVAGTGDVARQPLEARRKALFERYMPRLLQCRLEDLVLETPVQSMPLMSERLGVSVLIKREDLQPVFSFKLRGAYAKLKSLTAEQRKSGVICASAGNHAQGVALAAQHLGIDALVVMPTVTPEIKINAVRKLGAAVLIEGDNFDASCDKAKQLAEEQGREFIHPYDDEEVIIGQATLALELIRQSARPIDYLFICIGGGGLAAGVSLVARYLHPGIRIIGVEAEESASMEAAFRAGAPVTLPEVGHFAEGAAVKRVGDLSYEICSAMVDEIMTVSSDEICAAVQEVYEDTRAIAEPAGALAMAGIRRYFQEQPAPGACVAGILSGANVNFARLRHIAERAAVGEEHEALLAVTMPERPASFLKFCELVGNRSITEFNYRYADPKVAHIFAGIALRGGVAEKREIVDRLQSNGYLVTDLSSNDMARLHIRHMVGGRARVPNEQIFRFEFPERPGALLKFLRGMQSNWNVSLFHYRNYAAEYGRVLMGIQVPDSDTDAFQAFLDTIAYPYQAESHNIAYQMFVGPPGG